VGVVSLESVELWRPRRAPRRGGARLVTAVIALALIAAGWAAGAALKRPLVVLAGPGLALALALAAHRARTGPPAWGARRPRRWVPRLTADRRAFTGVDRRRRSAPEVAAAAECKLQEARRAVASRGASRV
jgi:hypothetical protein